MPLVSIITVVRNDLEGLRRTLQSISAQVYSDFQLVVVDGLSTDGTAEFIKSATRVDAWVSGSDEGIYHAMNKGVAMADGEWLLFMNAGDEFVGEHALVNAVEMTSSQADVVYSDWVYREDNALTMAELARMNVRHQSVLYRKSLHDAFGMYVVGKGVTISDFVFFLSIAERNWVYCPHPIAVCDRSGASGRPAHFHQRMAIELLYGRRSRMGVATILLLHPVYRFLKRNVLRIRRGRCA